LRFWWSSFICLLLYSSYFRSWCLFLRRRGYLLWGFLRFLRWREFALLTRSNTFFRLWRLPNWDNKRLCRFVTTSLSSLSAFYRFNTNCIDRTLWHCCCRTPLIFCSYWGLALLLVYLCLDFHQIFINLTWVLLLKQTLTKNEVTSKLLPIGLINNNRLKI
jgi:hypothetical protein